MWLKSSTIFLQARFLISRNFLKKTLKHSQIEILFLEDFSAEITFKLPNICLTFNLKYCCITSKGSSEFLIGKPPVVGSFLLRFPWRDSLIRTQRSLGPWFTTTGANFSGCFLLCFSIVTKEPNTLVTKKPQSETARCQCPKRTIRAWADFFTRLKRHGWSGIYILVLASVVAQCAM